MNPKTDLKALWKQQSLPKKNLKELKKKISGYRKKHLRILLSTNLAMLTTLIIIVLILYILPPRWISTYLGMALTALAVLFFQSRYNRIFPLLRKLNYEVETEVYLAQLKEIKTRQHHIQSKVLRNYFYLLGSGITLYMLEYAALMPRMMAFLAYGLWILWIGVNWIVFRPISIRIQRKKLNDLIQGIEALEGQLNKKLD